MLHYGLTYHVDMQATKGYSWAFDKHWYQSVDMLTCPGKLFPEPPTVDDIPEKSFGPTADAWYKQSLAVLNAQALHQGLREHHQLLSCVVKGHGRSRQENFLAVATSTLAMLYWKAVFRQKLRMGSLQVAAADRLPCEPTLRAQSFFC